MPATLGARAEAEAEAHGFHYARRGTETESLSTPTPGSLPGKSGLGVRCLSIAPRIDRKLFCVVDFTTFLPAVTGHPACGSGHSSAAGDSPTDPGDHCVGSGTRF